jgi:hypothetical protein
MDTESRIKDLESSYESRIKDLKSDFESRIKELESSQLVIVNDFSKDISSLNEGSKNVNETPFERIKKMESYYW